MIKESALKAAVSIFNGTLNAFKDAALDDRNKFTDEQRDELVALIDMTLDKQNIEPSLTKIKSILTEFGVLYEKYGGDITIINKNIIKFGGERSIIRKNMENIKKKVR